MGSNADSLYFLLVFMASLRLLAVEHGFVARLPLSSVVSEVCRCITERILGSVPCSLIPSGNNLHIHR